MPLIKGKSKAAFEKNLKTEMEHGHPMKQSLAIAYSMKRKAQKYKTGGKVYDNDKSSDHLETTKGTYGGGSGKYSQGALARAGKSHADNNKAYPSHHEKQMAKESLHEAKEIAAEKLFNEQNIKPKMKGLAEGGPVLDPERVDDFVKGFTGKAEGGEMSEDDKDADFVARVMHKRKMMSKGGQVANDTPPMADDEPAEYDDLVLDDDMEFHDTGANSGDEDGDAQEDKDRHDIVSRIMKSRKKKDKNPNPA